jgi:hypothetical protein
MLVQRPALMQLRMQQLIGQNTSNTLVVGMGPHPTIIPVPPAKGSGDQEVTANE